MEHTLGVAYMDSRPAKTISSSLVGFGAPGGGSAMSRSVGLTAAVGVHRVMAPPSVALPPLALQITGCSAPRVVLMVPPLLA